jgi:acyl carrier protein
MAASTYPLSGNQQLVWQMQRLLPGNPLYCEAVAWRILSEYDVHALRRTCQWLVDRHAALRTTYRLRGGELEQIVHETMPVAFRIHDARDWDDEELGVRIDREVYRAFDLEAGPMLRANLFLRAPGQDRLLLSFHHIAADFYSLMLILEDVRVLYPLALTGGEPPPPPATAYAGFVRWQATLLAGPDGARQWEYWRTLMAAPIETLQLPADAACPDVKSYEGRTHQFRMGGSLTARLHALARGLSVTMNVLLVSGFQVLLRRWCGQPRFRIRTIVSGRTEPEFARVVGHFANAVPLLADFADDPPFTTVVGRAKRAMVSAIEHQDLPLPELARRLRREGTSAATLSSDVMFRLQIPHRFRAELREQRMPDGSEGGVLAAAGTRMDFGGLVAELFNPIRCVAYHALDLELVEAGGEIAGYLHYRPDMFAAATTAALADSYIRLLANAAENPGQRVTALDVPIVRDPDAAVVRSPETGPRSAARIGRPRTAAEERAAQVWQQVLGVDAVEVNDTFFGLGGDSLAAAQVGAILWAEFGQDLPLGMLLASPTLAEFAAHVERLAAG